jgi:hypothetical protein
MASMEDSVYPPGMPARWPATPGTPRGDPHRSLASPERGYRTWALRDSNPQHPACKAGALPVELKAQVPVIPIGIVSISIAGLTWSRQDLNLRTPTCRVGALPLSYVTGCKAPRAYPRRTHVTPVVLTPRWVCLPFVGLVYQVTSHHDKLGNLTWTYPDSNRVPPPCRDGALPSEL